MTLQRRSVTIHLYSAQIKVESGQKSGIILPHPARCFQLPGTDRGEQTTPIEEIGQQQLYTLRSGTPLVLETIQHLVSPQFLTHHSSHTDQCHFKFSYAAIHVFPPLYRLLFDHVWCRSQTDRRQCCFRPCQPLVRSGCKWLLKRGCMRE